MKKFALSKIMVLVGALVSCIFCFKSYAVDMKFSDFSDISMLTLNGSAQIVTTDDGKVLRITPAKSSQGGSFFSTTSLNASNFSSFFQFRITQPGGAIDLSSESGADGLVFVVQSVSSSIGGIGGSIGYGGIEKSIGVEFDTFHNSGDPNSNHAGIDTAGSVNHKIDFSDTVYISTKFDNGALWYSWIDYDGTTLELRISQTQSRPSEATLSMEINIVEILEQDTAYVGFTSGTGDAWANHDIVYWEYRDSYDPIIPCDVTDSDGDGVIDQWDTCPNTTTNSWVDKNGCPTSDQCGVKGDIDDNGTIGLEEAIYALQVLSGLKTSNDCSKTFISCNAILQAGCSKGNGNYTIDPDGEGGNAPFDLYCDMTTDDGGWSMIYELDIPATKFDWNEYDDIPYMTDMSKEGISFSRIAYRLEVDDRFAWASMDDFTNGETNRIGIPIDWNYQITVSDLNVISDYPGVENVTSSDNGNIEFWSDCYLATGGDDSKYDYTDTIDPNKDDCYGSFQIFNNNSTILSFNCWSNYGYLSDLGIGDNPGTANVCSNSKGYNHPDWTFCYNAPVYEIRKLKIYVK